MLLDLEIEEDFLFKDERFSSSVARKVAMGKIVKIAFISHNKVNEDMRKKFRKFNVSVQDQINLSL